ncbi:TatD family hydrolase [candidate division KSB1 bacterium]
MFIDTHTHLQFSHYDADRSDVIESALRCGIDCMINVGTNIEDSHESAGIAKQFDRVYASAGIHPHDSEGVSKSDYESIDSLLKEDKVVALGEIGLDFYRDYAPRDIQEKIFRRFLQMGADRDVPVIIHNRGASREMKNILSDEMNGKVKGVMHCFSGDVEFAEYCIEAGLYISFTGNITYKNFKQDDVIRAVPLEKILIETDCPFLSPHPVRGKRNEPANVKYVAEKIAEIKKISLGKAGEITSENARTLFGID